MKKKEIRERAQKLLIKNPTLALCTVEKGTKESFIVNAYLTVLAANGHLHWLTAIVPQEYRLWSHSVSSDTVSCLFEAITESFSNQILELATDQMKAVTSVVWFSGEFTAVAGQ